MDFVNRTATARGAEDHEDDADEDPPPSASSEMPATAVSSSREICAAPETELARALTRFGNALLRGALAGFCLRGGLNVVSVNLTTSIP